MPKNTFPDFVPPMMAESAKAPFDSPDWIFEIKLDGYRAIRPSKNIRVTRGKVALHVASRSNRILFDRQPLIHVEPKSPVGNHVRVDKRRQCT